MASRKSFAGKPALSKTHKEILHYSRTKQVLDRIGGKFSNVAFLARHPKRSLEVRKRIGSYAMRRVKLTVIKHELSKRFIAEGVPFVRIFSRAKTTKSIAEKISVQKRDPERVYGEAIGLRVIARNKPDCYRIAKAVLDLGSVKNILRREDYISAPRAYGYGAIHIITDYFGYPVEIQIRSVEMERKVRELDDAMGRFTAAEEKIRRKELNEKFARAQESLKKTISSAHSSSGLHVRLVLELRNSGLSREMQAKLMHSLERSGIIRKRFARAILRKL